QPGRDDVADLPGFRPVAELEIALEQLDDGQIRRRLAVRDGPALQDEPPPRVLGMDELPEQPRLAGSRLTLERDDLPVPGLGAREHPGKSETLPFPAHVRGEAATERNL